MKRGVMLVAKLDDRIVRVVKTAETVQFSPEKNWVLVEHDLHLPERKRQQRRWLPVETTRFDWVRNFDFG
jgi:hypothetical protein